MVVKNIDHDSSIYEHLTFGHCLVGQFKQAIALFREYKVETGKEKRNLSGYGVRTLVTEGEVKAAKCAAAVMIICGVKPIVASHRSVIDELYKGEGS
ncbi:pentatricopeptide repeat-containing protein [Trifolium medium]|uniref:Pentatricopeptide repeat-containing protein n=1 Tax=Trifolium medium TaxID=97028 RepID=A0A392QF31_9FABA|nr:pentatricopeptide repeat-containing protein [Trifolium medium]